MIVATVTKKVVGVFVRFRAPLRAYAEKCARVAKLMVNEITTST
jgi:hypothetical protein